eukprot:g6923.t2
MSEDGAAAVSAVEEKSEKGGDNVSQDHDKVEKTSKANDDQALPTLKQASILPSRLHVPQSGKFSPSSSRNSSISGKLTPPRGQRERGGSYGSPSRSLAESLDNTAGERAHTAGGRRILVSASSGINLRAAGSPGSSVSSARDRREERGKSLPTSGSRGVGSGGRPSLSNRSSPRTSQSPDTKRTSMSFGDFVAASNTELSLLESSRFSSGGKRSRDRDALRVAVRIRPLIAREKGSRVVACDGGDGRMVVVNPIKFKASADAVLATASAVSRANMATSDWLRPFDFDRVFWSIPGQAKEAGERSLAGEEATQQHIFEGLGEKIVEDVLNGFNCSCFAYGHTGSGKTYSMFGCTDDASLPDDEEALAAPPQGEGFGLVPRICYSLLHHLEEANKAVPPHEPETSSVGLSVQFIEIYNDKIRDLLHPGADSSAFRVREHPQTGPYVDNLVPVQVESWSQLRQLLALGISARAEADTPENSKSSRGHAILTLEVNTPSGVSRVQMVDLAGSEREVVAHDRSSDARRGHDRVGGGADGRTLSQRVTLSQRLRETAQIKKALSNLGIIIKGLSRGDTPVGLPFRDSILTWLLKEALSGRAHTTMLATVSPSSKSYVETMNTLKYAERLKKANAHLNKESGGPRISKPSDGMKKEMESLVEQLGADGIEAKRQVLYQTVSDPQQRIAKLTAKDPRRRRTSSGGSSLPLGGRYPSGEDGTEQRRTSFPGSPSSHRFGWNPATPSRRVDDRSTEWGSPINTAEDISMESNAGGGLDEGKHDLGGGVGTSDDEAGDAGADTVGAAEVVVSRPSVRLDGREGTASADEPELKLYSESESDRGGDGISGGGKSELDQGGSGDGAGHDGGDSGGGGGSPSGDEGSVPVAPLHGGGDDAQHTTPNEQRPNSWLQSPGAAAALTWAGTSSSEDAESPGSARTDATTNETAPQMCTPGEVDDEATVPAYPPAAAGDDVVPDSVRDAVQGTSGIHMTGSSDTYVGGSSDTFFGGPSYTKVTVSTPMGTGEVRQSGGQSGDSDVGSTTVVAGAGPDSENLPTVHVGGSTAPSGEIPGAEQWSETHDTGSTAARGEDAPGSTVLTGNVDGTKGGDVPSGRITWEADGTEQGPVGRWNVEERKPQEGKPGGASHRRTVRTEGVRRDADQTGVRLPNNPGRNNQRVDEGDDPLLRETLNSSVESGGGAAALAASGVFDVVNTSSELEAGPEEASVGDADSLDGLGVHEPAWAQQHPVRDGGSGHTVEGRSGRIGPTEDTRSLIEDLMRQIEELKASNAALAEEVERLKDELSRSKESEEEAWALGDDTAKEFQSRLASIQRDVEEERGRAREAERSARDADARAESMLASGDDAGRLLDEARTRMREAEQRADQAESKEQELAASEGDARARLGESQAALEEQEALAAKMQRLLDESQRHATEANQRADQAEARGGELEARVSDACARLEGSQAAMEEQKALAAEAQRLLAESRRQMEEAEQCAAGAEAKKAELEASANDARARLEDSQRAVIEAHRLLEESQRRVKAAEQRADGAEAREAELEARAEDASARAGDSQATALEEAERMLSRSRRRANEAEKRAAGAEARAEELEACANDTRTRLQASEAALKDQVTMTEEAEQLLQESRRQAKKAEQQAAGAEAREKQLEARANETRSQLEGSKAALRDQILMTEEAERISRQTQAALEATGSGVNAAVAASRRTAEQERERAAEAEVRANRAVAKANELASLVDEQEARLTNIRATLEEEGTRADGAEVRERRAVARAEELASVANEKDKRLATLKQALEAEGGRAAEIAEGKKVAEHRAQELEREAERQPREMENVKREAQASLDALRAAAEAKANQAAQQRSALIQERDRSLEQVEAERAEVLRLAAELNDLRAASEQEAIAAREREASLKAMLACETEASRAEQVEVGDLLSLISAAQNAGSGDRNADEPEVVSIPAARVAVETQRAKYEAARRRLQALEDENRLLRQSEAEAQGKVDQLGLLEEERDFLLQEKATLVDRLGNLEARQGSFQERERQAATREGEVSFVKDELEEEIRRLKQQLLREAELRAKEAKEFDDRLKEKDEQAAEQLGDTLKQVMEGVKSQAGHIRGTVSQLEDERDRAIRAKDAATKELENVKCQFEALNKEKIEAKSDFEEQMKQSARERAALWLAVNKLDVLEAAKDAAIKELQKEGEDKARALKVLQAHNAGLTRELGQVDMSLMQALEDNGLTLDSVRLQNTPISRRLGRRRPERMRGSVTNDTSGNNPSPELEEIDPPSRTAFDTQDDLAGKARANAVTGGGAFGRDDAASWQRTANRADAVGSESRSRPPRPRSNSRSVAGESASRHLDRKVDSVFAEGDAGGRGRTYSGSSVDANRWDPAINTIEREISELSERLDPSRGGKRLRLRSSRVSPPRTQEARKRERGGLVS